MPGKNSKGKPPESGRVLTLVDIEELLDLLAGRGITEFEMEQAGVKIRIKRGGVPAEPAGISTDHFVATGGIPVITPPGPVISASSPVPMGAEVAADSTEGLFIMKSPIVGTFYASPSPSAPPFAAVGDSVQVGQVVCIIEAMKLMNELEAEVAGQIVRAYVESGQPVEYGQSLFAIEPARKK